MKRINNFENFNKLNEGKNQETQYRIKDDFLQYKKGLFWKTVPKPYVDDYDGVRKPFTSNFMFPEKEFKKRHFSVYKNSLNGEYKGGIFIGDDFYNINKFIKTFKNIDDYLKLYKVEQDKLEKKSKDFNKEKREKQKQLDKEKRTPKYLKNNKK